MVLRRTMSNVASNKEAMNLAAQEVNAVRFQLTSEARQRLTTVEEIEMDNLRRKLNQGEQATTKLRSELTVAKKSGSGMPESRELAEERSEMRGVCHSNSSGFGGARGELAEPCAQLRLGQRAGWAEAGACGTTFAGLSGRNCFVGLLTATCCSSSWATAGELA